MGPRAHISAEGLPDARRHCEKPEAELAVARAALDLLVVVVWVVRGQLGAAERALVRGSDAAELAEAAGAAEGLEAEHHMRVCAGARGGGRAEGVRRA